MNYLQPYLTNVIRKHHLKKRNEEPHKSGTSTLELNLLTPLNEGATHKFSFCAERWRECEGGVSGSAGCEPVAESR